MCYEEISKYYLIPMKLQYLGDTHDFLKYYLLRQLSAVTGRIGVIWMLTPNDHSNDGKVSLHLKKAGKYQALDPELHAKLEDITHYKIN